jgi:signal transduction histidine kinase
VARGVSRVRNQDQPAREHPRSETATLVRFLSKLADGDVSEPLPLMEDPVARSELVEAVASLRDRLSALEELRSTQAEVERRIESLAGCAARLSGGDLGTRIPVPEKADDGDPLGELRVSFELLRQALLALVQELEAANQAKSTFLSRMSHELRTPLNAILGFAQLLEADHRSESDRESVGYIVASGRHLLSLVDDVLDISRSESGKLPMVKQPVNLHATVEVVVGMVTELARSKGVSIHVGSDADEAQHASADPIRLRQVLVNLLANAIKFNSEGGSVHVSCHRDDRYVTIEVADTGPGISPSGLERLFEPFEPLGIEGSRVEGAGLGLTIAKSLVEAMGGHIGVSSSMGQGTTFSVHLTHAEPEQLLSDRELAQLDV